MRALALVKGSPLEAITATTDRGFKVLSCNRYDSKVETCYLTVGGNVVDLMRWFCERDVLIDGYGYPSGTLLYYGDE